jgi:bifunctional oligoribonuclease and PAP phosphatase NrnA
VCLACHVGPDGDALGSMLSLALALRSRGARVVASYGEEPFVVPTILRFLPGIDLLREPSDYPAAPDVMVTFDVANIERLGSLTANAEKADQLIVIDHHASNTHFGTLHLIDVGAAATSVLVERLIRAMGVHIGPEIATGLYVGLATDTGSFRFASTTPDVHRLAGRLLGTGLRPDVIGRELWDTAPFGYLQVLATALRRAVIERAAARGHGLVWTAIPRSNRKGYGLSLDVVESIIDVVRKTAEADVAAVFKEDDSGDWRVSVRSKGNVDVGWVCAELGGGGHPSAAGFTARGDLEPIVERFRSLLSYAVVR